MLHHRWRGISCLIYTDIVCHKLHDLGKRLSHMHRTRVILAQSPYSQSPSLPPHHQRHQTMPMMMGSRQHRKKPISLQTKRTHNFIPHCCTRTATPRRVLARKEANYLHVECLCMCGVAKLRLLCALVVPVMRERMRALFFGPSAGRNTHTYAFCARTKHTTPTPHTKREQHARQPSAAARW